jgi:transcriptional regulator with XRE-family HTH domain
MDLETPIQSPIRTARVKKKLTQAALAERVGVTKASVSGWEIGTARPDIGRLAALSRALAPFFKADDYLLHVETPSQESGAGG